MGTVEEDIKLIKWIESQGISIQWLEQVGEWGYINSKSKNPTQINGGFNTIQELTNHLINRKGETNARFIQEGSFFQKVEEARKLQKF